MNISIAIVDDHKLFREGIKALLLSTSKYNIIGEANDGKSIIDLIKSSMPNIILMDIFMPLLNGIEATKRIKKTYPNIKIIGVSMNCDPETIFGFIEAGGDGFLSKNTSLEELNLSIDSVINGKKYLTPDIAEIVIENYKTFQNNNYQKGLTEREMEILQLISEGKTSKDIADLLNLSIKTILTHRQNLMNKLDCHNVAKLTKYAIDNKIIYKKDQ
jgi:DNA-binding NarL/FixJ family response regulator